MSVQLDHINIKASAELLEEVKSFYMEVLGLKEGFRPEFSSAGSWLYSGEQALIHLSNCDESPESSLSGHLDHVAFRSAGLTETRQLLDEKGISFHSNFIHELNTTQLFFRDPTGTKIELSFPDEH